ncbi:nucleoporin SEH1-like [Haliotis asinina]|uniref:nucleoporin SEH1-like n=1 Tax=Haliotis asinina TaxID=109174 RepID=UPI0035320CDC
MYVAKSIPVDHKDLIHDVSYDFHGTRMATCSSDQSVKVWDLGEDGEWHCTANWKTHSGSVWRVTWAHPEFGQVLATCSFDRTAAVWEELVGEHGKGEGQTPWVNRGNLVDSRTSVTDVKFGPQYLGLQLATCSADGIVRIYEAVDVMNLSNWPLQHEISCRISCSCLSWNHSRVHPPMIAVGSDDPNPAAGAKVHIYEYNDNARKWNKVESLSMVTDPVHDVAFAPNLGRSYHLLAITAKDLKIISLKPLRKDVSLGAQASLTKFEMRQVASFGDHESQVWRVSWNVTGTILASSGDDGCVRLWKANYLDSWKSISVMKGDGSPQDSARNHNNVPQAVSVANGNTEGVRTPPPGTMNIKRLSNWPFTSVQKDQAKLFY